MIAVLTLTQSVILLLWFSSYGSAQDIRNTCCNLQQQKCRNVTTVNLTTKKIIDSSPLYLAIVSTPEASEDANACYTYMRMSDTRYLQFTTTKDLSGKLTIKTSIITDNNSSGVSGFFRVEGNYGYSGNQSTVHDSYFFAIACSGCQPIYISYRKFLLDSCEFVNSEYDTVYGVSASVNSASSCLDRAEELILSSGLQVSGLTWSSGTPSCVARFNNIPVINADLIDEANAISYPEDSDSCNN